MTVSRRTFVHAAVVASLLPCVRGVEAQQLPDTNFDTRVAKPAFRPGEGPVVMVDAAHGNFHTAEGRYRPFADVLKNDGYRITSGVETFSATSLAGVGVLVIANAGVQSKQTGSAFSPREIEAVSQWVRGGGSLFLIADHMPAAGAAAALGAAFGAVWPNGFALDSREEGILAFRRDDGSLANHAITRGRDPAERVDVVVSFTGSAFRLGDDSQPLLTLGEGVNMLEPKVAWQFLPDTPRTPAKGWSQGAAIRYGKGRVALFGEAAMFSAQRAGPEQLPMGMNDPRARGNKQFLLNVVHWLSGILP